jgi:archaellum component FlaC
MDKLEKLFSEYREAFEEEPLEGHFDRFETKLDQYNPVKKRKLKAWPFLKIASVLIIVLLLANLLIYVIPGKKANNDRQFANSELNETANFYTVRINSGLSQLQRMADQGIGSEQELLQVKKEMDEMDKLYRDLQIEYSKNPNDERVVNALIEYYQTKLNIINTIKSDLENIKTIKNKNHENTQL